MFETHFLPSQSNFKHVNVYVNIVMQDICDGLQKNVSLVWLL